MLSLVGPTATTAQEDAMDKFLIVGLGNPGERYAMTRHNIGWLVADAIASDAGVTFEDKRYGFVATVMLRGRKLVVLKPTTMMNLSGNAVRYWLNKEHIDLSRLLVIVDDLALPVGRLRLRRNGSSGGHNGLGHIAQLVGEDYARLKIGIGNDYARGTQIDWVLGTFSDDELSTVTPAITTAVEAVKTVVLQGIDRAMNIYNKK